MSESVEIIKNETAKIMDLWNMSLKAVLSRMPFSGMWRPVALVRTDVSEENNASSIRVKTKNNVSSN
jgi:vesicle coat complex subunit